MYLDNALRKRIGATEYDRTWQTLLWSKGFFPALKYVAFRSRGYAMRQVTYRSIDLMEIFAISLIASTSVLTISAGLILLTIFESLLLRGVLESLRCFLITGKKIPPAYALIPGVCITFATYFGFYFYLHDQIGLYTELIVFFGVKLVISCSSIITQSLTATIYAFKRVYYPPILNFVAMGSAALLTALVGYVLFGFYVAAFGFMAIRIGSDMIGLFLAKRAEQNSHDLAQSENLKKLSLKDLPDILRRATTMASQFFAPATAMLVSSDGNVFIRIWAMQVFILALCSRPFRSIFVDAYHLVQKKLWRLLYYRLYMSAAIAGLLLVTTSAAFFLLGLSLDNSSWVWAAWVFCATCNGLYLNYLQTMAQDTKVFWQYATLRLLAATSILGAGFFIADSNAIPIACVFEGVLLLFVLRHATTFHGVQSLRCEVANTKPADQDSVAISPFRKFLLGKQVLDENQVPHRTLILTLTKSYKSSRNMTLLIEDIKLNLRSHDTVMAINARKIKVWCAGTSDTKPIYQRLIQAFPLEIEAINEISEAEQPPAKTGNIATLLDRKTVFKNTPIAQLGTWWVLDHTGHWVTETEQGLTAASAALNFELCKIYTKLESLVFLEQNRKHTIGDHSVYAFRPFGFTQGFLQISNQEFSAAHIVKSKTDVAGCFKNATESYRLNHNIRIDLTQTVSIESWSYIEMLMTSLVSAKKVTGSVSRAKHKRRDGEALDKCTKNILAISTNGQSPIELYIQPNTKEAI